MCIRDSAYTDTLTSEPVDPCRDDFSGFVFKIQANMDKNHRDRIAFVRICSGKFERGMDAFHVQGNRKLKLATGTSMMADDRAIVDLSLIHISKAWTGAMELSAASAASTMARARHITERRTVAALTCNPNESRQYRIRIPAQPAQSAAVPLNAPARQSSGSFLND